METSGPINLIPPGATQWLYPTSLSQWEVEQVEPTFMHVRSWFVQGKKIGDRLLQLRSGLHDSRQLYIRLLSTTLVDNFKPHLLENGTLHLIHNKVIGIVVTR